MRNKLWKDRVDNPALLSPLGTLYTSRAGGDLRKVLKQRAIFRKEGF